MAFRPRHDHAPTGQTHQPDPRGNRPGRAWRRPGALALFFACTGAVFAADLTFKAWAFRNVAPTPVVLERDRPDDPGIGPHEPRTVVPYILSLHLSTNTGAVFGLGKGNQGLLGAVSVLATGVILWAFLRSDVGAWPTHLALALVLAGALGNLYDRFQFGAVRDMLWLFPGIKLPFGWNWPGGNNELYPWLFNIADAALVTGVTLLMVLMWRADRRQRAAEAATRSDLD